jgi:hypothetical protein
MNYLKVKDDLPKYFWQQYKGMVWRETERTRNFITLSHPAIGKTQRVARFPSVELERFDYSNQAMDSGKCLFIKFENGQRFPIRLYTNDVTVIGRFFIAPAYKIKNGSLVRYGQFYETTDIKTGMTLGMFKDKDVLIVIAQILKSGQK